MPTLCASSFPRLRHGIHGLIASIACSSFICCNETVATTVADVHFDDAPPPVLGRLEAKHFEIRLVNCAIAILQLMSCTR